MPQASIQVTGVEKVIQNILKLQAQIKMSVPAGLTEAADTLRDAAIQDLQGKLGTSWTGKRYGHDIYQKAIEDKASWIKAYPKWNEVLLQSTSEHSAIVEFGGTKTIDASSYGYQAWPIGASKGDDISFRPTFRLQMGYHYLTTSINNPSITNSMINEVGKILKRTIAIAGV